jgi:hypothetical protein
MKFFIPGKIVFSLKNLTSLNETYTFDDIKKFKEYIINFNSQYTNSSNICLQVNEYHSNNKVKTHILNINESLICSNYNLEKISISIIKNNNDEIYPIDIEIIEENKNFRKGNYNTNKKILRFIDDIKSNEFNFDFKFYSNIKIASILDEFSYACFCKDVDMINLYYDDCLSDLRKFNPDILLVESAWGGFKNSWQKKIASKNKIIDSKLYDLIEYCNKYNIPTVFWNKEGVINFEYFKASSSIFDYIFVTDENIIPLQVDICNHNNIYILEFAAQPKIHNSIDKNKYKLGNIAFAGAWYGDKHLNRLEDMNIIVKPSIEFGLDIFDRNYNNKDYLSYINLYWPEEYQENIIGTLDYNSLVYAYKNYDLFLNVNSIKNSRHMTSRRVYEILCSKTPILSSSSDFLYNSLSSYFYTSNNSSDTKSIIKSILNDDFNTRKISKKSQRFIIENHTYKNRLEYIFDTLELNYKKYNLPFIFIIGICDNLDSLKKIYSNIINQSYNNINYCIIVDSSFYNNIDLLNIDTKNIYSCDFSYSTNINEMINNLLVEYGQLDYFCLFNSNYHYSENYIRDYVNTLSFVNSDVIGKNHILLDVNIKNKPNYLKCSDFMDSFCNSVFLFTTFISKSIFKDLLGDINFLSDSILNSDNTFKIYSDDEFNISLSSELLNIVSI